jgi:hypothetical protein
MMTAAAVSPVQAARPSGKHDPAARRRAQRRGRERGCWVYITGQDLERAGYTAGEPAPFYRVWGGERGRYVVTLYREP